ncbi:hypothetical protein BD309DRAFT_1024663 [Dichomitus squalens]|uniref:Uncharacterized protein n=2 Tax=Dichomitus squalens TaxID=114155 RepID=A0A4Q9M4H9_9APHY|nr:uncharacterized protein DICSQDRAFT_174908 [Dichomitus squalens LYAD-421 SS1]EJF56458.1 hypothetical protein DICSQDRAFT_174908 [Dichomitus squalens LYAD-421 SS1]TBU21147.1 hypothetical protein BD311DRAFT_812618 [Dichomitus squalens]TBU21278.1 hypothetical protein BD311DRAFT_678793 [Dichomitus squalens]TBU36099.1 hypothetical protein BD309DRAFT_1024663 [Dichomitus squalens]
MTAKSHEDVIWQFLNQAKELQDSEANVVVRLDLDVEEPLEHALARVVGAPVKYLGKEQPDKERMGQSLAAAQQQPPASSKQRESLHRYNGILAEVDVQGAVGSAGAAADPTSDARKFWDKAAKANSAMAASRAYSESLPKRPHQRRTNVSDVGWITGVRWVYG